MTSLTGCDLPGSVMTHRVPTLDDACNMMFLCADPPSSLLTHLSFLLWTSDLFVLPYARDFHSQVKVKHMVPILLSSIFNYFVDIFRLPQQCGICYMASNYYVIWRSTRASIETCQGECFVHKLEVFPTVGVESAADGRSDRPTRLNCFGPGVPPKSYSNQSELMILNMSHDTSNNASQFQAGAWSKKSGASHGTIRMA